MRTTMKDIAQEANVSITTVSRALSGKSEINDETASRIKTLAEQRGYVARNNRNKGSQRRKPKVIGLVIADNSNPLFSKVVKGVEDALGQRGFNLILANTDENYDKERHCIDYLIESGVDGILLTPTQTKKQDILSLMRNGTPVVLVGRHFGGLDVSSVVADDTSGAHAAIDHLIRLGHRNILFLNAPECISSAQERHDGYRQAFEKHGLTVDQNLIRICPPRLNSAYNMMKSVLVERTPFSAVFSFNDLMALGVFKALKEAGLRIPGDISLIGFDDIEFVSMLEPPLTTVHMPKYRLGMESARVLLSILQGKEHRRVVLPTELIIRNSTTRCHLVERSEDRT